MNEKLELKVQALMDGELPPQEAEEVRALVAENPSAASLAANLQAVKEVLRSNDQPMRVPETREFYWSKIARQIEQEDRKRSTQPVPWAWHLRRWLAGVAGATALVAVLVVAAHQSAPQTAFNQVSVTADGYTARTFRDQSAGLTYVFLHDTKPPADTEQPAAPVRNDGSSFNVEFE